MRWIWRLRAQRGSQMVEFALIAPILVFLVLAVPVFGLITRSWLVVSGAARDGARKAALYGTANRAAVARQTAAASVRATLDAGPSNQYFEESRDIQVSFSGNAVTVEVSYWQPTFVPLMGRLLSPSAADLGELFKVKSAATFMVEGS